jgi:hypothetical protein
MNQIQSGALPGKVPESLLGKKLYRLTRGDAKNLLRTARTVERKSEMPVEIGGR